MRLLNIESSPRGSRSASIAVTSAFIEAYCQACPRVMVDTLNVWDEKLPDFDQEAIGAKYKGVSKEPMDQAETAIWDKIQELAVRFQQADRIVLGVSMWNMAYPYKLKQLIDLACQRAIGSKCKGLNSCSQIAARPLVPIPGREISHDTRPKPERISWPAGRPGRSRCSTCPPGR
jgi:hypothetical protein